MFVILEGFRTWLVPSTIPLHFSKKTQEAAEGEEEDLKGEVSVRKRTRTKSSRKTPIMSLVE